MEDILINIKEHKIEANVFSLQKGYSSFDNVEAIRIVDNKYNLLIMEDYLPVIGEVFGNVSIVTPEKTYEYTNIKGYYKHSHNQFKLLIKEYLDDVR